MHGTTITSGDPGAGQRLRREDIPSAADRRRTSSDADVLLAVLDHGPVPRSTIARLAGLSPAVVGRHCSDLARAGLVREVPRKAGPNSVGRPHVPVDLSDERHVICGLHLGTQASTISIVDLRGRVIAREAHPHRDEPPADVLSRVAARLPGFAAKSAPGQAPLGLGVATGGWVDPAAGVLVEHPALGWRDVPVLSLLERGTDLPVLIDSHARALIKAEQLFGDRRSRVSAVQLFVGNVVDAAFAADGRVHEGPQSAAGSIAHLPVGGRAGSCRCGQSGCLQAAVRADTLACRAADAGIIAEPSFPALVEAASDGSPAALDLMLERARLIGRAAAMLLDMLNPEVLIVSEPGVILLPGCLAAMRAEATARSRTCRDAARVAPTSFAGDVLAISAGAVLLDAVYADPLGLLSSLEYAPAS